MTDKKHKHEQGPEASSAPAPAETGPESAELETLQRQLEEAQATAAQYLDGWQRTQAEFSNYKKRIERENATLFEMGRGEVVKRYLPVLDDLERALANRPADINEAWAGGIELICRKLQGLLEAEGLKRIEAEGQMFDPNLHEAISQEPSESHASGQVIAVVQQGYTLGDRVLRHALVRVAE
jgi:molecular chaperone GrpE